MTLEDDNRRNSEYSQGSVLTHMHGPSGTRGRDARSLDRCEDLLLNIYSIQIEIVIVVMNLTVTRFCVLRSN